MCRTGHASDSYQGVVTAGCGDNQNATLDLTAGQAVTLTAQWSASSASNTTLLDIWIFRLEYPRRYTVTLSSLGQS